MKPLLLGNTEVYGGPWVPTPRPPYLIVVRGTVALKDEIAVVVRDKEGNEETVFTIEVDGDRELNGQCRDFVRAIRTRSSGSEVGVWVS